MEEVARRNMVAAVVAVVVAGDAVEAVAALPAAMPPMQGTRVAGALFLLDPNLRWVASGMSSPSQSSS